MRDIPNFDTFVKVKPIHKGWSGDKKYYVETKDGERLLLRVSDILAYKEKQREFDIMKKMSATGMNFQMCGVADPYLVMTGAGVSARYSIPFAMGQIDGYFGKIVPEDFWEKYTYYMLAEMLYAFTVGVKMETEREETLHMFDDEVERIKYNGSHISVWYQNFAI